MPSNSLWTKDVVAQRAAEYVQLALAVRRARSEYRGSCALFRERNCRGNYAAKGDPKFRRSTRKTYLALQDALGAQRNAQRRLETAVRNCACLSEKF
jgi:hypothetical protein